MRVWLSRETSVLLLLGLKALLLGVWSAAEAFSGIGYTKLVAFPSALIATFMVAVGCSAARHWSGGRVACSPKRFAIWFMVMSLVWIPLRTAPAPVMLVVWSGVAFVGSAWVMSGIAVALLQKQ